MSQNSTLSSFSNAELLTQLLKNCGKIPKDYSYVFSEGDLNHFPFTHWEKIMFTQLLNLPLKSYQESEYERIPDDKFEQLKQADSQYFISKDFPYFIYSIRDDGFNEREFLETTKGSHNEYIIKNDKYFEGKATYEVAAVCQLKTHIPEDSHVCSDNEFSVGTLEKSPDTLIFKDGNPYNWKLENLIWASEANESFPVITSRKIPIGRYGNLDFGKNYYWDIDEEKVFYIKNFMKTYPTISQNGIYKTINLKDTKNNFHSISYDKLSSWMKKRGEAYLAKLSGSTVTGSV